MSKDEFMKYINYLGKTFSFEPPTDKDILATWYKPLENTALTIANKMAQMYFAEEPGRFKLAKLLEYKTRAAGGKIFFESKEDCKFCRGTGYIQVEVALRDTYTTTCRRCICPIGTNLPNYIKKITSTELRELDHNGKVIRDWNLHKTLDE